MSNMLTEHQCELILSLCAGGDGAKKNLGEKAIAGALLSSEIETLCELISNEMMMNGIEEDFESNDYGKELELLLDVINRPRLGG